jgi:hypothetical protein
MGDGWRHRSKNAECPRHLFDPISCDRAHCHGVSLKETEISGTNEEVSACDEECLKNDAGTVAQSKQALFKST